MTIRGTLLAGLLAVTFALPALAASVGAVALQSGRTCSLSERWPVGDPIRVCAILVEFQEDSIEGTTGTGRIGTGFDSSLVIDPLPHDREYFRDHLRFLRHYYETVSRGGVVFDTTMMDVFPLIEGSAYRLDYPMWHYNYNSDAELLNRRLVELFIESCAKASEDPELDFTRYNAILVFHAGVGKDFNLGYDPTPFDIPSAYISARDVQSYSGSIQIPGGVERGLILPEGENQREALDYDVELSLNGIMVKLFGNWLGLPDLFDTRTGHSGVGRWGMMDQGSGNMSALVPSLPTAWSRVYMEWQAAAVHLPSGRGDTLHVARFGRGGDVAQIVKIPVTAREYYVIENRDADADSVKCVTLWDRDSLHVMHVYYEERTQAREGFLLSRDRRIEYQPGFGVAVGASHYDFGIPGSGLLIWHIDEDVIVRGLDDNTVNADPDHRGVDLVEADGAQDIGREYGFASAGSGTELGIQEDAWYLNNSQHRAANRGANYELFADYSFPAARIYDGSYTRLRLSNFSAVDSVMSFVCRMEGVA
ncbi:hypothetical protein KJ815_03255, partial [bacterium]|nr:hypothetical protein [bacterium]